MIDADALGRGPELDVPARAHGCELRLRAGARVITFY